MPTDAERIAVLETEVRAIKEALAEMSQDVRAIRSTTDEIKGGKKALSVMVAAAGAVGAALTWVATHVTLKAP